MNEIFWWDGKREAGSIYTSNINYAAVVAQALKTTGWNVLWMIHSLDTAMPMRGYEEAYKQWKNDSLQ